MRSFHFDRIRKFLRLSLFRLIISKCNWLVLVLTLGYFAGQLLLSKFRVLLSLHSPPNGKKQTLWVLLSISIAGRLNEGKKSTAFCGMHIKTPCTVTVKERERKMREGSALKYSWEAFRILYSHE